MNRHDEDADIAEAEDQYTGRAVPHSERPGFLKPPTRLDPEIKEELRVIARELAKEQSQLRGKRAEASAPPSPPTTDPKPGKHSSELGVVLVALGLLAAVAIGTVYLGTQIEGLSGESKAIFLGAVLTLVGWAGQKLGVSYSGDRTALKIEAKRQNGR